MRTLHRYIFIGNQNDARTKDYGIRRGDSYVIGLQKMKRYIRASIETGERLVVVPYGSPTAFYNNWKPL